MRSCFRRVHTFARDFSLRNQYAHFGMHTLNENFALLSWRLKACASAASWLRHGSRPKYRTCVMQSAWQTYASSTNSSYNSAETAISNKTHKGGARSQARRLEWNPSGSNPSATRCYSTHAIASGLEQEYKNAKGWDFVGFETPNICCQSTTLFSQPFHQCIVRAWNPIAAEE